MVFRPWYEKSQPAGNKQTNYHNKMNFAPNSFPCRKVNILIMSKDLLTKVK